MSNELLWSLSVIADLSVVLLAFRLFKKEGLYLVIIANIIVCNIQVLKTISLFGLTTTLGNILYGSIFLATDLLSEIYGKKEADKGVWLGFFAMLLMTGYMQVAIFFKPHESDFASPHIQAIFSLMPRVAFGSLLAYFISQFHDVWAFHFWQRLTKGKHLWLRNKFATWVSQAIDTVIFCSIAFLGLFPLPEWWQIVFTTYLYKFIVSICDTPFVYLGRSIGKKFMDTQNGG